ncbi:MAG TPA: PAS domain S-box protein [Rubrobacteraceae bacterium]|nr:PAS domain S-box protein [Rubrobacteraceae bacterium]
MRLTVVSILIGFSSYAQVLINKRKRAEAKVQRLNSVLENRVTERTAQLTTTVEELKTNQRMLQESEERFRSIFEQAAVGIAQVSLDGRLLRVNGKLCQITGYTREEICELPFQDIICPNDVDADFEDLRRMLSSEIETYKMERRYSRADGSPIWINLTVSLGSASVEESEYCIVVVEDITRRKQAENELTRLASFPRLTPIPIIEAIPDEDLNYVNPAAADLFPDLNWLRLKHPMLAGLDSVAAELRSDEKESCVREVKVNGDCYHQLIARVPGSENLRIYGIDITERKRSESAMREIRESERRRLARDLHDEALQDLIYALHEVEIMQITPDYGRRNPALEGIFSALQRSVDGMRGAIHDLRAGDVQNQPFPLLLESLIEQRRRMTPNCEIELIVQDDFPSVNLGAPGMDLLRIFQEALANVRRHAQARHARVTLQLDGDELQAEIADDGIGFEPGATYSTGVTGMRERATALNGELEIQSDPGKGTRLRFQTALSGLLEYHEDPKTYR